MKKTFAFRQYLMVYVTYKMPIVFSVMKASNSEQTETEKMLKVYFELFTVHTGNFMISEMPRT